MGNYRRLLSGAVLLAILSVTAITFNYRQVEAQNPNPGSAPVNIVSPLPLPVKVTSLPPVTVTVAARTPFQTRLTPDGTPFPSSFMVPTDQRLTIEFVSIQCTNFETPTPGRIAPLVTTAGGTFVQYSFNPKFSQTFSTLSFYSSSDSVRIYGDPGTSVIVNGFAQGDDCVFALSGFLEPVI